MLFLDAFDEFKVTDDVSGMGCLEVISDDARRLLDLGMENRAVRLWASKAALRALMIEECKCTTQVNCLKCNLHIDDGDFVILLNCFATRLLHMRYRLHSRWALQQLPGNAIGRAGSVVNMYQSLIHHIFPGITHEADLVGFIKVLRELKKQEGILEDKSAKEFFEDSSFEAMLTLLLTQSGAKSLDRRGVRTILDAGRKITTITERKLDDEGDCSLYPQEILYHLLAAHDAQYPELFFNTNNCLSLKY